MHTILSTDKVQAKLNLQTDAQTADSDRHQIASPMFHSDCEEKKSNVWDKYCGQHRNLHFISFACFAWLYVVSTVNTTVSKYFLDVTGP